jgi:diguanylate cyclase (GGDEF)-like protein
LSLSNGRICNEKKSGMIIYCDMDGLKKINDTFGHDGGDKAIIAQSKILLNSCSDTDIVARFAGDEFVVASLNMTQKGFEKFKKSVAKQCEFFNSSSGFEYQISISMGAAAFGPGNYDLPIILAQADIELYKDKRSKKKEK